MKHTKFLRKLLALAATVTLFVAPAYAGPVSGQGTWQTTLQARDLDGNGTTDAFYDTSLNITWLRNAIAGAGSAFDNGPSAKDGRMTWGNAVSWAAGLNFGGYSDWRLPTMVDTGTPGCNQSNNGTDCGYNVQTASSEMAHLFFVSLGNKSVYNTFGALQSGSGLTNTGNFQNMQSSVYWSGLEYTPGTHNAWYFFADPGKQGSTNMDYEYYAMAVRPGDVTVASVPEPDTLVLALAALAGLGFVRRRRAVGALGL